MDTQYYEKYSFLKLINILSLDVVAGAACSSYLFSKVFHADLSIYYYSSLMLSVWSIYTLDHLGDALTLKSTAHTERHLFHFKYRNVLTFFLCLAILANAYLILFILPETVLRFGVALGALVLCHLLIAYLLRNKAKYYIKEFFISLYYAIGVSGIPYLLGKSTGEQSFITFLLFFLCCLGNLFCFSLMETEQDKKDKSFSLTLLLGKEKIYQLSLYYMSIVIIITFLTTLYYQNMFMLIILLMDICLIFLLIFIKRNEHFPPSKTYLLRLWGDGIFIIPAILFSFA